MATRAGPYPMKCPKCSYLGFETGDRCKNCGYDFSLMEPADVAPVDIDLSLRAGDEEPAETPAWREQVDRGLARRTAPFDREPALPLFGGALDDGDDRPLVKLPAAPRAPLAVRRTPEVPKLRTTPRPHNRSLREPPLKFVDEQANTETATSSALEASSGPARDRVNPSRAASQPGRRLAAAALDHGLLLAIDLVVVYFTLRMAALSLDEWEVLPAAPLLTFLILVKLAYFCAFTAVGGQTLGKMAAHIRVVADTGTPIDGARAMRRALAGTVSALSLGMGFLPALLGSDRRALHDRMAGTRVVDLRSA